MGSIVCIGSKKGDAFFHEMNDIDWILPQTKLNLKDGGWPVVMDLLYQNLLSVRGYVYAWGWMAYEVAMEII